MCLAFSSVAFRVASSSVTFCIFFFEDLIIVIAADGGGGGGRPFGLGGIVAAVCDCDAGCDDVKLVGALFDAFKVKSSPFPDKFRGLPTEDGGGGGGGSGVVGVNTDGRLFFGVVLLI